MKKRKHIVVIGGGTGIFPVTQALRHFDVDISTIITVSDSGGSTGRIRDEFGFQPVGDLRQSLAALAEEDGQQWIRKLLLYRFEKGDGLKGHNLGNLILTALQDMTGDTSQALFRAQQIFRLEGKVIPATRKIVDLKIVYTDKTSDIGEDILDQDNPNPKTIDHVELEPAAWANPYALDAITDADLVIIGPGDYYASLMAALAPKGIRKALNQSKTEIAYIVNLMTRVTQTKDMTANDHVKGIEKEIGRKCNHVIVNTTPIPNSIRLAYANEHEYPVLDDLKNDPRVVRAPILGKEAVTKAKHDTAHRSLLRHDSNQLQKVLKKIL